MDKRFIDLMTTRAEEFASTGRTQFSKWELLLWHDQQNVSKNIWRNILSNVQAAKPDSKPRIFESWGTYYLYDEKWSDKLDNWAA